MLTPPVWVFSPLFNPINKLDVFTHQYEHTPTHRRCHVYICRQTPACAQSVAQTQCLMLRSMNIQCHALSHTIMYTCTLHSHGRHEWDGVIAVCLCASVRWEIFIKKMSRITGVEDRMGWARKEEALKMEEERNGETRRRGSDRGERQGELADGFI